MKIAIVTGASSGIGSEFAKQLDRELGHTDEIWLLARRKDAMEELAQSLHTRTRVAAIDLTDEAAMRQFEEVLAVSNPRITVLVNCAGVGSHGAFRGQGQERIDAMIRLNIAALTGMTRICLPYMRRGSKIIQIASAAAFVPQASFAVYAASKAYVYSFSRALSRELKESGITVTAVCPGPVDTPFLPHAYGPVFQLPALKKLSLVKAEDAVFQAIVDCRRGRSVSVCGLPVKLLYLATQGIGNLIQRFDKL